MNNAVSRYELRQSTNKLYVYSTTNRMVTVYSRDASCMFVSRRVAVSFASCNLP